MKIQRCIQDIEFYYYEENPTIDNWTGKILVFFPVFNENEIQKWEGVDQMTSNIDQDLQKTFFEFLEDFFKMDLNDFWQKYNGSELFSSEKQSHNSKNLNIMFPNITDEDLRSIPGGRYGCA